MPSPSLPVVALVGRVNVGKSRLFNRLLAEPRAIVSATPGTTRDRSYAMVQWRGVSFRIVDTGGLIDSPQEDLLPAITRQALEAIREASLVLLILDGTEGVTPVDRMIARQIRHPRRPFFSVVNKVDATRIRQNVDIGAVERLGAAGTFLVSAKNGVGTGDLLDGMVESLRTTHAATVPPPPVLNLAIIGKPNVGKSSLVNRLAGEERVIVHATPHTTREPQDIVLVHQGQRIRIVDTAGIRRQAKRGGTIEHLSVEKSLEEMTHADVVALVLDATEPLSSQDLRLLRAVGTAQRPATVIVNKWDLVKDKTPDTLRRFERSIRTRLGGSHRVPILMTSATTGIRVREILDTAITLLEHARRRLTDDDCRRIAEHAPLFAGKRVQEIRQARTDPPTFTVVLPRKTIMSAGAIGRFRSYLRTASGFDDVPMTVIMHVEEKP